MIEVVLGKGTTLVRAGMRDGRRFVALTPRQKRRKIGAKLGVSKDEDFHPDDIVIWLDKPESAKILRSAVDLAIPKKVTTWQYVVELSDSKNVVEDVRGAS